MAGCRSGARLCADPAGGRGLQQHRQDHAAEGDLGGGTGEFGGGQVVGRCAARLELGDRAADLQLVAVPVASAGQLQRAADRIRSVLCGADIGAGLAEGRAVLCRERAFVAEELDDGAGVVHQRDGVRRAVLDAVDGIGERQGAEAALLVGDDAAQAGRAVDEAVRAVVQRQRPAAQVGAGLTGDLDELAGIGAGIVVVELVDEHGGHARSPLSSGTRSVRRAAELLPTPIRRPLDSRPDGVPTLNFILSFGGVWGTPVEDLYDARGRRVCR